MRINRLWTWWQAVRDRRVNLPAPQARNLGDTEQQLVSAVNGRVRQAEARYHHAAEPLLRRLREALLQLQTIDLPQFQQLVDRTGRTSEEVVISRTAHNVLQAFLTLGELVFNMIVFLVLGESTLLTWAMALAVGLGLPAVAVFFGTELRQAQWTRLRVVGWTVVLAIVAATLAGINYIRTAYMSQMRDDAFTGDHPGLTVAYFTINIFVFVAATLVAYFGHDPVHGFVKAKARVEGGRAAIAGARARLNGLARRVRAEIAEWHDTGRVYVSHYRAVNRRGRGEVPLYFDDESLAPNQPAFYAPDVPEFADDEHSDDSLLRSSRPTPQGQTSAGHPASHAGAAALLLCVCGLSLVGCGEQRPPRMVSVFVDGSCSVRDTASYADAWARVVETLHPGDRVVLGRIEDGVYTTFRPVVDEALPVPSLFNDNALVASKRGEHLKAALQERFSDVWSRQCSQKTPLLDTLSLAEKVFGNDPRDRVLVLGSDMLEDGERYDFAHTAITPKTTARIIAAQRAEGLLPNLSGVEVHVVGASAASTGVARRVQAFWDEYFRASGASFEPLHYGPVLTGFGPSPRSPAGSVPSPAEAKSAPQLARTGSR